MIRSMLSLSGVLLLLSLAAQPSAAQTVELTAKEVHLYPSGMKVLFSVPNTEKIQAELPGAFDGQSVRLLPPDGVTVTSFSVVEQPRSQWVPPALSALDELIREKKSEITALAGKTAAIDQSTKLFAGPFPQNIAAQEVPQYVETIRQAREKLETERSALVLSLEERKKELQVLQTEYAARAPQRGDKSLVVNAEVSGKGDLLLEAWTTAVQWAPQYKMNLRSETGEIAATLQAKTSQRTGLSFDVPLHFHTVQPSGSVKPPHLPPLVADFYDPAPGRRVANYSMEARSAAPMDISAKGAPDIVQTATDMSVQGAGLLPGDGLPVEITLGSLVLQGKTQILSIPQLSDDAWITAKVAALPDPLLPGTVLLSVDGSASGTTSIGEHGAGMELEMAFGKMPLVVATRKPIVPKEGSSWIGKGRIQDGYVVELTNGTNVQQTVTLKDRLPLPAQERIAVEVTTLEPKPKEQDKENILTWEFEMAPGEKKTVEVLYRVTYPGDKTLILD